ncbi:LOW QUALITY PROTEIN: AfsR/dnrI/redD regulatory protein, partial [Micromonospora sp. M42]
AGRPEGAPAPGRAGPAGRRPGPGGAGRADRRRPVGRPAGRRGGRGPHVRRGAAPPPRAAPSATRGGPAAGHRGTGVRAARRPGRRRRLAVRGHGQRGSRRAAPGRARPARRGAGLVARTRVRRLRPAVGARRTVPARPDPAHRRGAAGRGAAGAGPGRRRRTRSRRARRRVPVAGGRVGAAGLGALPGRTAGRRARRAAPRPGAAARPARAGPRTPAAAAGDRLCARPNPNRPARRASGRDRRGVRAQCGARRAGPAGVHCRDAAQPRGDRAGRTGGRPGPPRKRLSAPPSNWATRSSTARVIGGYDVPAIWTRSDDPAQAARVVAAAQRALAGLGPDAPEATRARLLATVAIESRGTASPGPAQSAREAEAIARRVADPALLAQALNGVYMQTFQRAGLAPQRDAVGVELVALAARHGLATVEILGHLIRVQARSALADFTTADAHADAADRLAARHESPLVGVFTGGYRAMRTAATGAAYPDAEATYRSWATGLAGCGMPGVERGLLPLALLCLRVWHDRPAGFPADTDWGPYAPWARPLVLLSAGRRDEAASALRRTPAPPRDLLQEALWCLTGRAAVALGDRDAMLRARDALVPAAGEVAGAGSGLLTVGPVAAHLDRITAALLGSPG